MYCENCHVGNVVPDDVTISGLSEGVWRLEKTTLPVAVRAASRTRKLESTGCICFKLIRRTAVMTETDLRGRD